jgi:hypothetical protein
MQSSDSYVTIEKMIHLGEFMLSDLERLLETLHRQERITNSEQEALLELAWRLSIRKRNTPSA